MHDFLDVLRDYGLQLLVGPFPEGPLGGLALTLVLAITGLVCAFPLAVFVGIARTSPFRWIAWPVAAMVHCIRGLPVLMLLFWAYFVVPLIIGRTISGVTTVICALVVYEITFLGEVIKGGILAIPKGQIEASRSLGLGYFRTLRDIILPQALFNMIPSILTELIALIKNTSLAYVISVNELTFSASQINTQLLTKSLQVYFILAMIYFIICYTLSTLVGYVETRIKHSRSLAPSVKTAS